MLTTAGTHSLEVMEGCGTGDSGYLLEFQAQTLASLGEVTEVEPNDFSGAAQAVQFGDYVEGSISAIGRGLLLTRLQRRRPHPGAGLRPVPHVHRTMLDLGGLRWVLVRATRRGPPSPGTFPRRTDPPQNLLACR